MHRAAIIFLASAAACFGATYYVSTTGNDAADGSQGTPWATVTNAAAKISAGDTVLVNSGTYSNENWFGAVRFAVAGTAASPIVFRSVGGVTNFIPWELVVPYYTIDGFTWDGVGGISLLGLTGGGMPGPGSGHVTVTNCTFQRSVSVGGVSIATPPDADPVPTSTCGTNIITHCRFLILTNGSAISLFGVNNLVENCLFADGQNEDSIYPMGSNSIIRCCTFTNMNVLPEGSGYSNHPDILQAFGDMGRWAVGILVERCYIINCPIQLMDFSIKSTSSTNAPTNSILWGVTLRNCVIEDSTGQASIDFPNVHFENCTFRRNSSAIAFAFYDPNWASFRGTAEGGYVKNCAFMGQANSYSVTAVGPNQGLLTNAAGTVKGRATISLDSGVWTVAGIYTNLSGGVSNGVLYCPGGDLYTVDAANFTNNIWFSVSIPNTDPAGGVSYADQQGYYLAGQMDFRLNTMTLPAGEVSAVLTPYSTDLSGVSNACDYNFMGWASEAHGIQSGNTNVVATNGWPVGMVAPMLGSVLIDGGTNLTSLGVTNDYMGNVRPLGSGFDIGAFEFDPSLIMRLDFDESMTGRILDTTGHTNSAWQMDATNWITATTGVFGTSGGWWQTNAFNGDGYAVSQYGAITNLLAGLDLMTNGTVSFWAWIQTNGDMVLTILDCGYDPTYSSTNFMNSWTLARDSDVVFALWAWASTGKVALASWPSDTIQPGGGSPNLGTTNWHLYTATWTCTTNLAATYYDGVLQRTNGTGNLPFLHMAGYIALGAMAHAGTPQWADDAYPNAGFYQGRMDDVRIYNRALTSNEVMNLYLGNGTVLASGGGSGPTPPSTPTRSMRATTIRGNLRGPY